jgi:hypothetical protein
MKMYWPESRVAAQLHISFCLLFAGRMRGPAVSGPVGNAVAARVLREWLTLPSESVHFLF